MTDKMEAPPLSDQPPPLEADAPPTAEMDAEFEEEIGDDTVQLKKLDPDALEDNA